MVFVNRRQRQGRAYYWVCGALVAVIVAIFGYQKWLALDRHSEDEKEREVANKAKLVETKHDVLDWPQWRGAKRDGIAPGDGLLTSWPKDGPPLLWKVPGGGGYSAPVVANGRLITMVQRDSEETVVCWDAETGKERWAKGYSCRFTQDGVGPRGSPVIDGERVYTVGAEGQMLCLDVKDGKEIWSGHLSNHGGTTPKWGFSFSPLVEEELLIIVPGGTNAVVALDRKDGKVKWKADVSGHPGYSSPILCNAGGKRQVLVFLGKELVSLDPASGKVYWKFEWDTQHQVNAATPIVVDVEKSDDAYVFISSNYGKGCALLRVTKGDDGPTVKRLYKNNLMKNHFGSCVLYKDHLYGFDDGYLVCIPFLAGKPKAWLERNAFKGRGTVLLAGDQLIVLGEYGKLALVEPSPDGYREKASFQINDNRLTWTMPVLAQKRLYVRDEESLYCYDLRAK